MRVAAKKESETIHVSCAALTPEQKAQLCDLLYKQRKEKKSKSEKAEKADKLVDPSSVSILGPATSDDHVEQMDMSTQHSSTTPDSSEKFNELFASGFTKLESLLAKLSSHESHLDSSAFHPFQDPSSTALVGLNHSFQGASKPPVPQLVLGPTPGTCIQPRRCKCYRFGQPLATGSQAVLELVPPVTTEVASSTAPVFQTL